MSQSKQNYVMFIYFLFCYTIGAARHVCYGEITESY